MTVPECRLAVATPFASFWMGGFEGADHVNSLGVPLDMARSSGHVDRLDEDHARAASFGLRSIRESVGWRLAETAPGRFDLARVDRIAASAERNGLQVLWSLMHYGTPADINLFDDAMIARFVAFAEAVARRVGQRSERPPVYNLINEIGFLAWSVSATNSIHPYRGDPERGLDSSRASGYAIKRRLVRAVLAGMEAVRRVDPRARFLHVEPVVHVIAPPGRADLDGEAQRIADYQWQAWDMIAGLAEPELGGSREALDLVGVNHYHSSQWELETESRLRWHEQDPRRCGLAQLLGAVWQRYQRPLILAETSHIGAGRAAWLNDVANEVRQARRAGTPVDGICLYPLVDRPDWEDAAHWHQSGLWDVVSTPAGSDRKPLARRLDTGYAAALVAWQAAWRPGHEPITETAMPHLIVFCHLRWAFVYQRPQHLMSRLARQQPVLFVEEPLHLDPGEGPPRIDEIVKGPGVTVLVPRTPVTAFGFHDDQLSLLKPLLADYLRLHGIDDYLIWFYTPMALPLASELRPRAVVYDCMDELSAFKDAPRQLRQRETALLKTTDLVFAGGPSLYEAKRHLHEQVHCLPSSVDVGHFAPAGLDADGDAAHEAARLQESFPRPRLGFFGVIDERLDVGLVEALALAHPEWQIVMVGPVVKIDPAKLPRHPNLHWLGMQPYPLLPYLMAGWDLCLMPFALNDSTRFISPTKTLEYFAGEKPVVSTAVPDVVSLHGAVARIARDHAGFIAACEAALVEGESERSIRRKAMAATVRNSSWDRAAARVQALIKGVLKAPAAGRAATLPATSTEDAVKPVPAVHRAVRHVRQIVIGAGPAGLAAAYHLGQGASRPETLLVERAARVGGRCRSVSEQGYTFDHGRQAMFSNDPYVLGMYQRLRRDTLHWQDGFLPLLNCELALDTSVLHVSPSRRTLRFDDGRSVTFDALVSTMLLPQLVQACGEEAPPEVCAAANALRHVAVRCVDLGVRLLEGQARRTDSRWIDYPEGAVFQRVFVQRNASPPHTGSTGRLGLTCEISYSAANPLPCDGEALTARVIADCRAVGLIGQRDEAEYAGQFDVPCGHVVHDAARAANVARIRDWFASFGIVLAGRDTGAEHHDVDHPFLAGRRAAAQVESVLAHQPAREAGVVAAAR